jgi:hypothetical protein
VAGETWSMMVDEYSITNAEVFYPWADSDYLSSRFMAKN